jgi:general secretion pathway protein J
MDRLQSIQRAVRMLADDLQQVVPRPIRDELGDNFRPALDTGFQSGFAVEMTRGGWSNPIVLPRSTMQRVGYRIEDNELVRYQWFTLDRTLSNEPTGVTLLDDVESLQFRFFDASGEFTEQWPPISNQNGSGIRMRPRAVEFILTLADEGELSRLLEVAP